MCARAHRRELSSTPWPAPRGDHHLLIALLAWRRWTGTYKEVAGNVSCSPCPSNTSSPGGKASCSPCPIYTSSPAGSAACLCNPVSATWERGRERDDGRKRKTRDKEKMPCLACCLACKTATLLSREQLGGEREQAISWLQS